MFATERDMRAAQTKPIMYNNFRVYWVNEEKRETRKRESFEVGRGRSWDRYSQTSYTEENRSSRGKQKNRTYAKKYRDRNSASQKDFLLNERHRSQSQSTEDQIKDAKMKNEEIEDHEERPEKVKIHKQEEEPRMENFLEQIWKRLERLEETREIARESLANRS
jgi:flagellar biosynthesis GTPase FlhF